jgi:F0F1-type ATP synthase epsilon subunit
MSQYTRFSCWMDDRQPRVTQMSPELIEHHHAKGDPGRWLQIDIGSIDITLFGTTPQLVALVAEMGRAVDQLAAQEADARALVEAEAALARVEAENEARRDAGPEESWATCMARRAYDAHPASPA